MKKFLTISFLFLIVTTGFCQIKNSTDDYLNELIKKKETENGFISQETYDIMQRLIESIIKEEYSDTLKLYGTPQNFETTIQNGVTTYYQVAPLNYEHDALFFWAVKNDKQWTLYSHFEKGIQETFNFHYKSENGFNFFICPEFCVYGKSQNISWTRIDFIASEKNYFQVYRRCEVRGDSSKFCMSSSMNSNFFSEIQDLQNQMALAISKTENFEKRHQLVDSFQTAIDKKTKEIISKQGQKITLTVSDFIFKDLDADGQEEIFWFSVSDNSVIDFKVYHLTSTGLIETGSENYLDKLRQTNEYSDLNFISNLNPVDESRH